MLSGYLTLLILLRYPIVERAVTDMEKSTLSDPTFQGAIRAHVTKILHEDRAARSDPGIYIYIDSFLQQYLGSHQ